MTSSLILNSALLGGALAMDAFSVSIADTLAQPLMQKKKMAFISAVFAFFQFTMPLIGWLCVRTLVHYFTGFSKFIPYLAAAILVLLGAKMIFDTLKKDTEEKPIKTLGAGTVLLQGIATSIDALSVGFTTGQNGIWEALSASVIIGAVTFGLCFCGLALGKRFAAAFSKAEIFGGVILIAIGAEMLIKALFFG